MFIYVCYYIFIYLRKVLSNMFKAHVCVCVCVCVCMYVCLKECVNVAKYASM